VQTSFHHVYFVTGDLGEEVACDKVAFRDPIADVSELSPLLEERSDVFDNTRKIEDASSQIGIGSKQRCNQGTTTASYIQYRLVANLVPGVVRHNTRGLRNSASSEGPMENENSPPLIEVGKHVIVSVEVMLCCTAIGVFVHCGGDATSDVIESVTVQLHPVVPLCSVI
jgi:hypothetical protein